MSFKESLLESIAKKIDSLLNPKFEKVIIRSLLTLGMGLIAASYGMSVEGKAEIRLDSISAVLDLSTGPSLTFLTLGGMCVAIAIVLYWKTTIVKVGNGNSDFENLVKSGVYDVHDYLLQAAFEKEHRYRAGSDIIRFLLEMKDPLFTIADYKKARSHVQIEGDKFKLGSAKKVGLISIVSLIFYFGGALLTLLMFQVGLFAFRHGVVSQETYLSLGMVGVSFALVSFFSLKTYGETAAARRLIKSARTKT